MQLKQDNLFKMDIKISEEKKNPLFNRKEILASTNSEKVPSKVELTKIISEKLSSPEENIIIKKISGKFGSKTFNIIAFIYDSKEIKDATEIKPKLKK